MDVDESLCRCGEEDHHDGNNMADDDAGELWTIFVKTNVKEPIPCPVQSKDSIKSITEYLKEVVPFDLIKLIYKGKLLAPDSIVQDNLSNGASIRMIGSKSDVVKVIQNAKSDPTIRGFAEEDRLIAMRNKRGGEATQDSNYKFCSFEVVENESTRPHPFEAERLLKRLATDPAIVHIMKKHKFVVGKLREMSPNEYLARKKEAEGGCLLGYNENHGSSISLRLRTDDLSEFRGYQSIINTLLHELAHNVWGEHDANFWSLFAELKSKYLEYHAVEARQGRLVNGVTASSRVGLSSSAAASMDQVQSTVDNEIRSQLANRALSEHERNGVAQVLNQRRIQQQMSQLQPLNRPVPPAEGSVQREQMRERARKAAEERAKKQ